MTTARERYERKTKVVTFRVYLEEFDRLEEIKAKTGLSNADLIKLGAGIAAKEIKRKLAYASNLEAKLAKLRKAIAEEERRIDEERRRRREQLDVEIKALTLFSAEWHVEEVALKLGISNDKASDIVKEWAKLKTDRETTKRELLRSYLKKHLENLKSQRSWASLLPSSTDERRKEIEKDISSCQHLLNHPSEISEEFEEFLIGQYS